MKLGICEDSSMAWNKNRIIKYLRYKTKSIGSWKKAHKIVYCEIYRYVANWSDEDKAVLIIEWFGALAKNSDNNDIL